MSKALDLLFPPSGVHAVFGLLPPVTPSPIRPLPLQGGRLHPG